MRGVALLLWLSGCDVVFRLDDLNGRADAGNTGDTILDAAPPPPCGNAHGGVIAVYPVDGDDGTVKLSDAGPNGIHATSSGSIMLTPGPADCSYGLLIDESEDVVIPADARFDIDHGAVDLWVRVIPLASTSPTRVVLARDQTGNNRGDLSLFEHRLSTGELLFVTRLQSGSAMAGGGSYRCSTALTVSRWYHVAINFGAAGFELEVDGQPQMRTGTVAINGESWGCGTSSSGQDPTVGIAADAAKPWYVGFGDVFETAIVRRYFSGGGIDHVRISSERF